MKMHLGNLIRYYVLSMDVRWGFTAVFEKEGAQHNVETAFVLGKHYSEKDLQNLYYQYLVLSVSFYHNKT